MKNVKWLIAFVALLVAGVLAGTWGAAATPDATDSRASGDVDCNGQVDAVDALRVLRYVAGLPNSLPPGCPPIGPTPSPVQTPTPAPTPHVLPPPSTTGHVDAGGKAEVTISNNAPHALTIEFSGPETRTIELGACATCIEYLFPPLFCPEKGPEEVTRLAPGSYDVTVRTDDPNIGAYDGSWTMSGDQGYFSCFYILKSFGF